MLLRNFSFESAYFSLKFKEGINPQIQFSEFLEPAICGNEKIYGYISKISIIHTSLNTSNAIYFVMPEKFPVFLINMTETFKKDLNHKNVALKFTDLVFNNLVKLRKEKFMERELAYKISAITLGSAELNDSYMICSPEYSLNAIYQDNYKITYKKSASEFMRSFFNFDVKPAVSISAGDMFRDLPAQEMQRFLNALLQKNFKINQITELLYCYPELKNTVLPNLSKKNQSAAAALLIQFDEKPPDAESLKNSISKNLIPVMISVIESNNFKIPHYLKLKNIYELYEYYKMRKIFHERPFVFWFEKILRSENRRIYEIELAKKEFLIGLADIDDSKLKTLFANMNANGFITLLADLAFLKANSDSIKILRAKSAIVNLINEIEIPVEIMSENKRKATELFCNTNDNITIQYISRTINQRDLFTALHIIDDKNIKEKFFRNFSKNMKSDFKAFSPVRSELTNYSANSALNAVIKIYDRLSEESKIKEK